VARGAELTERKVRGGGGGSLTRLGLHLMYAFRPSPRRRRHTVWLMLLAWLFALTAGVVNACVLSVHDRAAREGGSVPHAESALPGTAAAAQHEHGQEAGQDSCLKFCDDEATVLSKDPSSEPDLNVPLVEPDAWYVTAASIISASRGFSRGPPTSRGPPPFIRFLRLTL